MKSPTSCYSNNQRGAALVTVLFVLVLLAFLAVSLLSLTQSRARSSNAKEAVVSLDSLKDSAVNLMISQYRNATVQEDEIWATQPGAIRTFEDDGGDPSKIFKLYSDDEMVVEVTAGGSDLDDDLERSWDRNPEIYANLNRARVNNQGEISYPIVDPRAYNNKDTSKNPEGFSYESTINGVSDLELPMPVKWIYVLRDGSLGTLDNSSRFVPFDGSNNATSSNPMEGRFAFWADDETQKVNINTASEAIYWDTPRCYTPQDKDYADNQAVLNEVQRFGGHPATTCLSSVLVPGEYLDPKNNRTQLEKIYDITPRVNYDGGILAGTNNRVTFDTDRLYASVDELFFGVERISNTRERQFSANFDGIKLEQRRFFLTANSNSPEVNPDGKPRIPLWPLYFDESNTNFYSSYDNVFKFASTLGDEPYYYQRNRTDTQFADFDFNGNDNERDRSVVENANLLRYLALSFGFDAEANAIVSASTPGYSGNFYDKYGARNMSYNLFQMLDYLRTVNMQDDTLIDRNGDGNLDSRVQPWTTPTGSDPHYRIGSANSQYLGISHNGFTNLQMPKGFADIAKKFQYGGENANRGPWTLGRRYALSEVALVFVGVVKRTGSSYEPASLQALGSQLNLQDGQIAVQLAVIGEKSTPGVGYPNVIPLSNLRGFNMNNVKINERGPVNSATGQLQPGRLDVAAGVLGFGLPIGAAPTNSFYPMWKGSAFGGVADYRLMTSGPGLYTRVFDSHSSIAQAVRMNGTIDNHYYIVDSSSPMRIEVNNIDFGQQHNNVTGGLNRNSGRFLQNNSVSNASVPAAKIPQSPDLQGTWNTRLANFFNRVIADPTAELLDPNDVVRSFASSHGDARLMVTCGHVGWARSNADGENHLAPLPGWNDSNRRHVHTLYKMGEPLQIDGEDSFKPLVPAVSYNQAIKPDMGFDVNETSYDESDASTGFAKSRAADALAGRPETTADPVYPFSSNPSVTRDWDTGPGNVRDGGYSNLPDYGTHPGTGIDPYFGGQFDYSVINSQSNPNGPEITKPNHLIPSAGMFGSLPSMVKSLIPWTTFLFRPELNKPHLGGVGRSWGTVGTNEIGERKDKSFPPDHMLLEYFWMPVIQPYAISEPFSTAGKVGMNYRMAPFTHIKRATALHAVLKSERMLSIPTDAGDTYKTTPTGGTDWRNPIDANLTLLQWEDRFNEGEYFQSASEVCEMFLVPKGKNVSGTDGASIRNAMRTFWGQHQLTGDNVIERSYTNIYPRLTTKSNSFRVHYLVQTVKKSRSSDPSVFDPELDNVEGELQGDTLVERFIDPEDPDLKEDDYQFKTDIESLPLDHLYQYRIRNTRRF